MFIFDVPILSDDICHPHFSDDKLDLGMDDVFGLRTMYHFSFIIRFFLMIYLFS